MSDVEGYGFFAKDVSIQLDINATTLRRWCLDLEKGGYTFERNDKKQRIFYERDFIAFRTMKELLGKGQPMESAVHTAISRVKASSRTLSDHGVNQTDERGHEGENITLSKQQFEDLLRNVSERSAKLAVTEALGEIEKVIDKKLSDSVEKRDLLLVRQMNQALEQKKADLESVIKTETQNQEESKKWWEFWK
jgi:hypothetical protein